MGFSAIILLLIIEEFYDTLYVRGLVFFCSWFLFIVQVERIGECVIVKELVDSYLDVVEHVIFESKNTAGELHSHDDNPARITILETDNMDEKMRVLVLKEWFHNGERQRNDDASTIVYYLSGELYSKSWDRTSGEDSCLPCRLFFSMSGALISATWKKKDASIVQYDTDITFDGDYLSDVSWYAETKVSNMSEKTILGLHCAHGPAYKSFLSGVEKYCLNGLVLSREEWLKHSLRLREVVNNSTGVMVTNTAL